MWNSYEPATHFILFLGGLFGSLVRLVINPEKGFTKWTARVFTGVLCAVFLGAPIANFAAKFLSMDVDDHLIAATGFLIGSMGEAVLAMLQSRFKGGAEKGTEKEAEKDDSN